MVTQVEAVAAVKAKREHKVIDDSLMMSALMDAVKAGKSLSAFQTDFAAKHGYNPKSVGQKYFKWLKSTTDTLENADASETAKTQAQELYNVLKLKDGRAGRVGGGRAKINRLESLADIRARLNAPKSADTNLQTENKEKINATVENGDVVLQVDGQKITIHSEPVNA